MSVTVGVDIGGTKISAAAVDEHGTIIGRERAQTQAQDTAAIIQTTRDLVEALGRDHDVAAVGVACAAFIDRERANVRFAPNIAWRDTPLKAMLQEALSRPVVIENDANAAAWGEFCYGPAREQHDMVLLTLGTGVGGGVVVDGQLRRGAFGMGGELGHIRVVRDGHPCGCGNRGCLESYGSGTALVREARALLRRGGPEAAELSRRCGGDPEALTGPHVTEAALAGDDASIGLLTDLGRWVGEGAASLAAVLDPSIFVLGGGVASAGSIVLEPAAAAYRAHLSGRGFRPEPQWALASLGNDAGVIGAAALARDEVGS